MVHIDFAESAAGPRRTAEAHGRSRLLDVCDDARAPVNFGCRAARCTTCRIEVLEGMRLLEAPAAEEAELLASIAASPDVRLACQAVVRDTAGRLRLKWIGPLD